MKTAVQNMLIIFLVIIFTTVAGAAGGLNPARLQDTENMGLNIELFSVGEAAEPGEVINLICEIINKNTKVLKIEGEIELNPGWKLLIPLEQISLLPGQSELLIFPVYVGENSRPGHYQLPINFHIQGSDQVIRKEFNLDINKSRDITLQCLDYPARAVSGQEYQLIFSICSRGNVEEEISLELESDPSFPLHLEPHSLCLPPGTCKEIAVKYTIPDDFQQSTTQYIRLQAVSKKGKTAAKITERIKIIPRKISSSAVYHRYPLHLTLAGKSEQSGIDWRLWGRGSLTEEGSGELFMNLNRERNLLRYTSSSLQLKAGDKSFSFSNLINFTDQKYLKINKGDTGLLWTENEGWGLKFKEHFSGDFCSAFYYLNPASAPALLSWSNNFKYGPSFNLQTEYAQHLSGKGASALDISAHYQTQDSWTQFALHHKDQYFLGREEGNNYLRIYHELPLQNMAHIALNYLQDDEHQSLGGKIVCAKGENYRGLWWRKSLLQNTDYRWHLFARKELNSGDFLYQKWGLASRQDSEQSAQYSFYNLNYYHPHPDGIFNAYLNAKYPLSAEEKGKLGTGIYLDHHFDNHCQLQAGLHFYDLWDNDGRFYAQIEQEIDRENIIKIRGELNFKEDEENEFKAEAAYTTFFDLPLCRRKGLGSVRGCIADSAGKGVKDIIVKLAGETTISDKKGNFYFPAVPAGKNYLNLEKPEDYDFNQIFLPSDIYAVEVREGEEIEQDFKLLTGGELTGEIVLQDHKDLLTEGIIYGEPDIEEEKLKEGIIIELHSDEQSFSELSDKGGNFSFSSLPPGSWKLYVHSNGLPDNYQLRPLEKKFLLAEGESKKITIRIIPIQRIIQIKDGGSIEYIGGD